MSGDLGDQKMTQIELGSFKRLKVGTNKKNAECRQNNWKITFQFFPHQFQYKKESLQRIGLHKRCRQKKPIEKVNYRRKFNSILCLLHSSARAPVSRICLSTKVFLLAYRTGCSHSGVFACNSERILTFSIGVECFRGCDETGMLV